MYQCTLCNLNDGIWYFYLPQRLQIDLVMKTRKILSSQGLQICMVKLLLTTLHNSILKKLHNLDTGYFKMLFLIHNFII
jgi:hypothetical protein